MQQCEGGCQVFVAVGHLLVLIATAQHGNLLAVLRQGALYGVGVVFTLQIDELGTDVAHAAALVGHILHLHIAGHGYLLVLVHRQVIIAVEQSRDVGHIGDGCGQLVEVKPVKADGEVLQHG